MSEEHKVPRPIDPAECFNLEVEDSRIFARNECFHSDLIDFSVPVAKGLEVGDVEEHHLGWKAEVHEDLKVLRVGSALQKPVLILVLQGFVAIITTK